MTTLKIPASYYEQFDADHSLPHPAEAYGGWHQTEIEIAPARTALIVMHAWDNATPEEYPGSFRAEDHLGRANAICETVIPPILRAAREAGIAVLHVVCGGTYYKDLPGYRKAMELAVVPAPLDQAESDGVLESLQKFRHDHVFPGAHNAADCYESFANTDFHPGAKPVDTEGIAHYEYQLHALCKEAGVNHLVYTGFALDGCLLMAQCGMIDMQRRGYLCSVIEEATSSCEMKETATNEGCKQMALWRVSVFFGFVFAAADFVRSLGQIMPGRAMESN